MLRRPLLVVLAALALSATACGPSGDTIATVDGSVVDAASFETSAALYRFLGELNGAGCGSPVDGETADAACDRYALSNVIQERLAAGYAAEHDVAVPTGEAERAVADLDAQLGEGVLDQRLEGFGLLRADLVALAERILLMNAVRDALAAERVSEAELRDLYEAQIADFTSIHAKHILVEAKATAERIAAEVTPATFGDLAARYSIDPGSKDVGGDLGSIPETSLDPDFVAGALALEPGEIGPPVQTQFGWHVILLVSIDVTPFADVEEQLRSQQATEVYVDWFRATIGSADIEVNPRIGRLDTQTGEVLPIRSTATGVPSAATPPLVPTEAPQP